MKNIIAREAKEEDVPSIKEIFHENYSDDYPYIGFMDEVGLKHSVYNDDQIMLVAEDTDTGEVLGTASVVLSSGAYSDLLGEFGRLAVSTKAKGKGIGKLLMEKRLELASQRLHVGIVENRCTHPFSQKISHKYGFVPVGFLPMKHEFIKRESIALFYKPFGPALKLRKNNPRIIPEARLLAQTALSNSGIEPDIIVDSSSPSYQEDQEYQIKEWSSNELPALLRIERGRIRNCEVFGPVKLQYGFFRLSTRQANYLVASEDIITNTTDNNSVAGAIGYIHDPIEKSIRIFELITSKEDSIRPLFNYLLKEIAPTLKVEYLEIDVNSHSPALQRTLIELGFLPTAYIPAMVFDGVERVDVIKMSHITVPFDVGEVQFGTPSMEVIADKVINTFMKEEVLPQVYETMENDELFRGFSSEQERLLASILSYKEFEGGDFIYQQEDNPYALYFVLDGVAEVYQDDILVGKVSKGEILGEISAMTGNNHSVTTRATNKVKTALLTLNALESIMRKRPDMGAILYKNLALDLGQKLLRSNLTDNT
ncbi:MAG: GNAT family N-acetyltransferase [Bacteriovoracaceae bacterium]|nr:GNAT family N-acetyltransferase [Bacteriovoracaceae bacterium]